MSATQRQVEEGEKTDEDFRLQSKVGDIYGCLAKLCLLAVGLACAAVVGWLHACEPPVLLLGHRVWSSLNSLELGECNVFSI